MTEQPIEITVRAIVCDVLGDPHIDPDANLFEMGADSISASQVINRLQARYGLELDLSLAFDNPTIAGLSVMVEEALFTFVESLSEEQAAAYLEAQT